MKSFGKLQAGDKIYYWDKVNKLENRLASRKRTLEALKNTLAMFK